MVFIFFLVAVTFFGGFCSAEVLLEEDFSASSPSENWNSFSEESGAQAPITEDGSLVLQIEAGDGMRHVRITTAEPFSPLLDDRNGIRIVVSDIYVQKNAGTAPPTLQIGFSPQEGNVYTRSDAFFFTQIEGRSSSLHLKCGDDLSLLHEFDSQKLAMEYNSLELTLTGTSWRIVLTGKAGTLLQEASGLMELNGSESWKQPLYLQIQLIQGNNGASLVNIGRVHAETTSIK